MDPEINKTSIQNQTNKNSKIIEMQNMQKSSKSDVTDLERKPKVENMMTKSEKQSSETKRIQ